jgi:hypothetical protein
LDKMKYRKKKYRFERIFQDNKLLLNDNKNRGFTRLISQKKS